MRGKFFLSLLFAGLLFGGVLVLAPPVQARAMHAVLQRSDPTDGSVIATGPASIRLWFSEPVQLVGQSITILAPSGIIVDRGEASTRNGLLQVGVDAHIAGTYLVIWQVISQDTAPVSGRFIFSVRHVSGRWTDTTSGGTPGLFLQILARLLHLLGYALGFGSLAFYRLVLRPLSLEHEEAVMKRLFQLVTAGIVLLVLAEPLALLAQFVALQTGTLADPFILGDILSTSFGRVLAQRLGAALLLWVLMGVVRQGNQKALSLALLPGIILAFVDGQSDHAISSNPIWLGFVANALHIIAMAVWLGGLVALLSIWRLKEVRDQRRELIATFSPVALTSVIELVITGVILAVLHIPRFTALFTTDYGKTLTIKLTVFLLALTLVMVSRRVSEQRRKRWWTGELGVLICVLTLAALLVSLPPPS